MEKYSNDIHSDKNSSCPNSATLVDKMSEIPARWYWVIHHVVGLIFVSLQFSGTLTANFLFQHPL